MARTVTVTLQAVVAGYQRNMERAAATTRSLRDEASRLPDVAARNSQAFTAMGLALGAAGAAITLGLRSAANETAQFESRLTKSVTLIGISREQMQLMGDAALRLSDTGKGPQELADALFFAQSAGLRGADAMAVVESSAKAASIGLGDTAVVTDLVTSAVNAYGIESLSAAEATDVLIGTVREGKSEAPELAGALGRVLPIASEMGVRFDEVGAAVAAMTRTGTDARTSVTQLRAILTSLLKPAAQSEEALNGIGLSSQQLRDTIREDGLWAALTLLRDAIGDNEEALGRIFPNVRALAGFLDLTGKNAAANSVIFANMADTTGLLAEGFAEWSRTTEASQKRFSAAMEAAKISLGESLQAPMRAALDTGTGLLQLFVDLPAPMQAVAALGSSVAAVGLTLASGFLLAAPRINATKAALADLNKTMPHTMGALRGIWSFLIGPWGLAIGAATLGVMRYAQVKAESTRRVEEFTAAVEADTGALGDNVRALAVHKLEQEGALEAARQLGISTGDLVEALLGNEDAYGRVMAATAGYEDELLKMVSSQLAGADASGNQAEAMETVRRVLRILNPEIGEASDEWRRQQEAIAEAEGRYLDVEHAIRLGAKAWRHAKPEVDEFGNSLGGATEHLGEFDEALDPVNAELEDLALRFGLTGDDAAKAAQDMLDAWADSSGKFVDLMGIYNAALERKKEKEREAAEKAAEAAGESASSWEDFARDTKVTIDDFIKELDRQIKAQENWHRNMAFLATRVSEDMFNQLARLGPEGAPLVQALVDAGEKKLREADEKWGKATAEGTTSIIGNLAAAKPTLEAVAQSHGQAVADQLSDYMIRHGVKVEAAAKALGIKIDKGVRDGQDRTIPVKVTGSADAIERIRAVGRAVDKLPSGKKIHISATGDIRVIGDSGRHLKNSARGGPVDGPGARGVDSLPYLLAPGEYVMKAAARARYGDHAMAAINQGTAQVLPPGAGGPLRPSQVNVHFDASKLKAADFGRLVRRVASSAASTATDAGVGPGTKSGRVLPKGSYRIGRGSAAHGYPALDLPAPTGTPVYSVASGIVSRALRLATSYGIHAFVNHAAGRQSRYAHLSAMYVRQGQQISRGQMLGRVGSTGNSTGPHLHYEDLINGRRRPPERLGIFDHGGVVPPRSLIANTSHRPEALLTERQWRTLTALALARRDGGGGDVYNIHGTSEELVAKVQARVAYARIARSRVRN